MLFATITGPTFSQAIEQIQQALPYADGLELRLDLFATLDIQSILSHCSLPTIFTLRKKEQGGQFTGTEKERLDALEKLLSLEPSYCDIEYDVDAAALVKKFPKTTFICSYHNFEKTPQDLLSIYNMMQRPHFTHYKIATHAKTTLDALRMLHFSKQYKDLSGLCMGEQGHITRILGPIINNLINYACLEEQSNPLGQLSLQTLVQIYNYRSLNQHTALYALLGDPVSKSIGPLFHNRLFKEQQHNAVYVKLRLQKHELASFFSLQRAMPFQGFSVTTPLKEAILPYLDSVEEEIGAINTITTHSGIKKGINTDGPGALIALEEKSGAVRNKRIIIIGAGGSSKAIAFEAIRRGAHVTILNRTAQRAITLAKQLGCKGGGLDALPTDYDILINATTVGMCDDNIPIPTDAIQNHTVIMDIVYREKKTSLICEATKKKCLTIEGKEMFIQQALMQQKAWQPAYAS